MRLSRRIQIILWGHARARKVADLDVPPTSAIGGKADMARTCQYVR